MAIVRLSSAIRATCVAAAMLLAGSAAPARAQAAPGETEGLLAAIRDHVAAGARGTLAFDPRPIRPGAEIAPELDSADLMDDPVVVDARRARAQAIEVPLADVLHDKYCTFTEGVRAPPGRTASPATLRRLEECARRGPYTTFAAELATPVADGAGWTACTRVIAFTKAGFIIWRLDLRAGADGSWYVERAERVFSVWS